MRFLLAPLFVLVACDGGPTVCTDIAVAAFTVDLGGPIAGATVSWTGDTSTEACDEVAPGSFACAYEQSGDLTYTFIAPGYETVTADVTVGADECHPIPETVVVDLIPTMDCTMEMRPSLVLSVFGVAMDPAAPYPVESATVTYTLDGGESADCVRGTTNDYTCGWEEAGLIHYIVTDDAHGTAEGDVEVTEDTCHVGTVELDINMDCIAC